MIHNRLKFTSQLIAARGWMVRGFDLGFKSNRVSIPAMGSYCLATLMSSDRTKQICLWMTIYIYIYIYIYVCVRWTKAIRKIGMYPLDCSQLLLICWLVDCILWHINPCRLFDFKSCFIFKHKIFKWIICR